MVITLEDLRRFAVARSLFQPTTLKRALQRMGFVQADPIRAPARAQDLILRHRVKGYRAGDLERRYDKLGVEEDFFINYGFVTRELQALMHPRRDCCAPVQSRRRKRAEVLLDFVRERGVVHPQEVDKHFSHGTVKKWGGKSNATTHLLDQMHYQGLLRVARREAGIRMFAAHEHPDGPTEQSVCQARLDALADVAIGIYAPMPLTSLRLLLQRLRFAAPQWEGEVVGAFQRAKQRLAQAQFYGVDWYWPADWKVGRGEPDDAVRLLAPFDPVVWDRSRFELLWGWAYRFEAYTPSAKRLRGYYALPLLWRDRVIGWGNLSVKDGSLKAELGYVAAHAPRDRVYKRELEEELTRVRTFLGLDSASKLKADSSPAFQAGSEYHACPCP
jgi:uncharacterized protein YcaQ